jgi:hypothetical protein
MRQKYGAAAFDNFTQHSRILALEHAEARRRRQSTGDSETAADALCWTPHPGRSLGDPAGGVVTKQEMSLLRAQHYCDHLGARCDGVVCPRGSQVACGVRLFAASPAAAANAREGWSPPGTRPDPASTAFVKRCTSTELALPAEYYPCPLGFYYSVVGDEGGEGACVACSQPATGQPGRAEFVSHGGFRDACVSAAALPATEGDQLSYRADVDEANDGHRVSSAGTNSSNNSDDDGDDNKKSVATSLPTVALVIGAMKAGTMTLWEALSVHPHVFSTHKEHHYFDTTYDSQTPGEYLCKLQGSCLVPVGGELGQGLRAPVLAPSGSGIDLRPEVRASCVRACVRA